MRELHRLVSFASLSLLAFGLQSASQALAHDVKVPGDMRQARASVEPGKGITLQLAFECVKFQGECSKVQVLRPPKAQEKLWLSGTGVSPQKALQGQVIKDGIFTLEPGTFVYVKIAYANHTDREIRFRAIPHFVDPRELQGLALFNCMCLGETYRVPPGKGWFRVIRVGVARDMPPGSRFRATHTLTSEGLE